MHGYHVAFDKVKVVIQVAYEEDKATKGHEIRLKNGETKPVWIKEPTIATTAQETSNAGTYPINITGGEAKNYEVTYKQGTLTIDKATLTITFDGNNGYKPTSYTSQAYTVSGALGAFAIAADDQAIQQGQRSPIEPIITNTSGHAIGIRGTAENYETYVLDEEESIPNYADYFDFTYTEGSGSGTKPPSSS